MFKNKELEKRIEELEINFKHFERIEENLKDIDYRLNEKIKKITKEYINDYIKFVCVKNTSDYRIYEIKDKIDSMIDEEINNELERK